MLSFFFYLSLVLFMVVATLLILLILVQKGRGGGLASAFGGGGGNTAFGSKTGDVLTWATSIIFGIFLLLAVCLNLLASSKHQQQTGNAAAGMTGGTGRTGGPPSQPMKEPPAGGQPGTKTPTPVDPKATGAVDAPKAGDVSKATEAAKTDAPKTDAKPEAVTPEVPAKK